jgi:hypothetical protein
MRAARCAVGKARRQTANSATTRAESVGTARKNVPTHGRHAAESIGMALLDAKAHRLLDGFGEFVLLMPAGAACERDQKHGAEHGRTRSCSMDLYCGRSMRLKLRIAAHVSVADAPQCLHTHQVWLFGSDSGGCEMRSIMNFFGPLLPRRSLKPVAGTRDVPVTNCSNRERCSTSNPSTTCSQRVSVKVHSDRADRQRDRQRDRWTERQRERQRVRQRVRLTERETER